MAQQFSGVGRARAGVLACSTRIGTELVAGAFTKTVGAQQKRRARRRTRFKTPGSNPTLTSEEAVFMGTARSFFVLVFIFWLGGCGGQPVAGSGVPQATSIWAPPPLPWQQDTVDSGMFI